MNSKYTYLLKNVGLLTLSSFATKILTFLLVPLYTNVLSTTEYGTYDLFNTTISLLFPIFTLDIQEAVLRFCLDDNFDEKKVLHVASNFFWGSSFIIILIVSINCVGHFLPILEQYSIEFILMYMTTSLAGLITFYARGIGDIKDLSISSVIASTAIILCNLLFLLVFKLGVVGYFYATIIGNGIQAGFLLIKTHAILPFLIIKKDAQIEKSMIEYSTPMIANAISWWVNTASDRYVVTWLAGIAENGIYSVSYKIPSIISVLQSIFGQAWSISSVKEMDREDKSGFFINVYNLYNFMLVIVCSVLILIDKPLSKLLFAFDFYQAWKYVPFLLISTVFSGMAAFIGGLLAALKETKSFAKTSVITAILNTFGNVILVQLIGPIGAAISTALSYFLMWILRVKIINGYISLRINLTRDLLSYLILIIQATILILGESNCMVNAANLLSLICILLLYKNEIQSIFKKAIQLIRQ